MINRNSEEKPNLRARYILAYPVRHFIYSVALTFFIFSILSDVVELMGFVSSKQNLPYQVGIPFGVALFLGDFFWARGRR